jgi:hypothetical protein
MVSIGFGGDSDWQAASASEANRTAATQCGALLMSISLVQK